MSSELARIKQLSPGQRAALRERLWDRGVTTAAIGWADGDAAPASASQGAMVYLHHLAPDSVAYITPARAQLRGNLNVTALRQALDAVVRRHEALRTVLPLVNGVPVQRVLDAGPQPLRVIDLSGLPDRDRLEQARRVSDADLAVPFDLRSGPLLRVHLLRLAEREWLLLATFHHAVTDGWSLNVFQEDLLAAYAAIIQGQSADAPPPLLLQYQEYARWQQEWLHGEEAERQLAYWRDALASAPQALSLPCDRARPDRQWLRAATHRSRLPAALRDELVKVGMGASATLFMVLLAAYQILLARISGAEDILVGSQVANRRRRAFHGLIGYFANVVILRGRPTADLTFLDYLAQVRATCLHAFDHQEMPVAAVIGALHPTRAPGRNPLYQVGITLHNTPYSVAEVAGLTCAPVDIGTKESPRGARLDLELDAWETADGVECELAYATDLFEEATAQRLMRSYVTLLERVAAEPKTRLADLPVLDTNHREVGSPPTRPLDALEAQLAAIVADLLGIEPAMVADQRGFFELGGDSLLALKLIERVNEIYHTDLPVSLLLSGQTVGTLAAALRGTAAAGLSATPA